MQQFLHQLFRQHLRSGVMAILAALLLAACHDDDDHHGQKALQEVECKRAVMVYMSMQNSLGNSGYHRNDSAEIAQAMGYIPADDRLLLFIDDARPPRLYELHRSLTEPRLLKRWQADLSTASKEGLQEVLTLLRTYYKAEEYGLVFGSHATGWLPQPQRPAPTSRRRELAPGAPRSGAWRTIGIDVGDGGTMSIDKGQDGTEPDQIEMEDFARAVSDAGLHLRYLLFDCCLMQCAEVAYALRGVTDYIIASPISISAEGAYYTDMVRYGLFAAPEMVASTYASYYLGQGSVPAPEEGGRNFFGTVISCIRTDRMELLAQTVGEILQHLAAEAVGQGGTPLQWRMGQALNYHAYTSYFYYRPHFYDLYSALAAMGASETDLQRLRTVVDETVVYAGATGKFWIGPSYYDFQTMPASEEYCGISMFVPQTLYTDNAVNCAYGDLNAAFRHTEWYAAAGWSATGW